jgi:hypothetical protein
MKLMTILFLISGGGNPFHNMEKTVVLQEVSQITYILRLQKIYCFSQEIYPKTFFEKQICLIILKTQECGHILLQNEKEET